jgi:hypothetical protein
MPLRLEGEARMRIKLPPGSHSPLGFRGTAVMRSGSWAAAAGIAAASRQDVGAAALSLAMSEGRARIQAQTSDATRRTGC